MRLRIELFFSFCGISFLHYCSFCSIKKIYCHSRFARTFFFGISNLKIRRKWQIVSKLLEVELTFLQKDTVQNFHPGLYQFRESLIFAFSIATSSRFSIKVLIEGFQLAVRQSNEKKSDLILALKS